MEVGEVGANGRIRKSVARWIVCPAIRPCGVRAVMTTKKSAVGEVSLVGNDDKVGHMHHVHADSDTRTKTPYTICAFSTSGGEGASSAKQRVSTIS